MDVEDARSQKKKSGTTGELRTFLTFFCLDVSAHLNSVLVLFSMITNHLLQRHFRSSTLDKDPGSGFEHDWRFRKPLSHTCDRYQTTVAEKICLCVRNEKSFQGRVTQRNVALSFPVRIRKAS